MCWKLHDGGPNPIPGVKAGEYEVRFPDGMEFGSSLNSEEWIWEWEKIPWLSLRISHYRVFENELEETGNLPRLPSTGRHASPAPVLHEFVTMA